MQYTLRNIPPALDQALRSWARREGTSLNDAAVRAMIRGLGLAGESSKQRDLGGIVGSWVEDPDFDRAIEAQDVIDEETWR